MPDKDIKPDITSETVIEKEKVEPKAPAKKSNNWVAWLVIGCVVLLVLIGSGVALAIHAIAGRENVVTTRPSVAMNDRPRFSNQRTYYVQQSSSDGLTTTSTTTQYTQTEGVVTAVSGNSVTVAGGGKSQPITTNSSTTYVDDTKPAVNDTVVVTGTKDGSTITATQIEVLN